MTIWLWIGFILLILGLLALDLGVFHRKVHVISTREALAWTAFWVVLALAFNVFVYFAYDGHWLGIGTGETATESGRAAALEYLTGYIIEKSLSLDNIFVIALIFSYFGIPREYQHRVLFWGILGALIMRGLMIAAGAALIHRFDWIVYVFGAFLIFTAGKLTFSHHEKVDPDRNPLVRLARKMYPVSAHLDAQHFFTRLDGRRAITPLMLVLLLVESTDVLFAVDSIPAIFAVTHDPFIVFTSNVFAILGLRSLYFALAGIMERFCYLKPALVILLAFIGVKMILSHHYPIPTGVSLAIIAGVLTLAIVASVLTTRHTAKEEAARAAEEFGRLSELAYRHARRLVVLVIGGTLLLVGAAMILLPGPAMIVIPAGLLVLSTEFVWARRLLRRVRDQAGSVRNVIGGDRAHTKPTKAPDPSPDD